MTQQYLRKMGYGWESWGAGWMYTPTCVIFFHLEPSFNVCLVLICLISVSFFHLPVCIICHHFISFVFLLLLSWLHPTCCRICLWSSLPWDLWHNHILGWIFPQASTLIWGLSSPIRFSPVQMPRLCCIEQWWYWRARSDWTFVLSVRKGHTHIQIDHSQIDKRNTVVHQILDI